MCVTTKRMAGCDVSTIRELSRQLVRELGLLDAPHSAVGVSTGQLHALIELSQRRAVAVGELGTILNVDKSVSSRLVASMEEKGWVTLAGNQHDSRQKLLTLTKDGQVKVKEINGFCNDLTAQALSSLNKAMQADLERALSAYVDALRKVRQRRSVILRPLRKIDEKSLSQIIANVDAEFRIRRENDTSSSAFQPFYGKGALYVVAENRGKLCGGAGISPRIGSAVSDCEIQKLYLAKEARGLGIGQRLLDECLTTARRFGYRFCYALTSERFKAAIRLYEANGFKKAPLTQSGKSSCNRLYVREV